MKNALTFTLHALRSRSLRRNRRAARLTAPDSASPSLAAWSAAQWSMISPERRHDRTLLMRKPKGFSFRERCDF